MKEKRKRYRDSAKLAVMSHFASSVLSVIFSGLILTLILNFYQLSAIEKNIDIFSADIEIAEITLTVLAVGALVNLPIEFCASRFYLVIARKTPMQRASLSELFAPFSRPSLLFKGSAILLSTSLLTMCGFGILSLPIYYTYCMAVFVLADHPEMSVLQALRTARITVKGHRWTVFCTVLPLWAAYILLTVLFSSLYLFGFLISSVIQAMVMTSYAIIYDDIRDKNESAF